MPGAIPAFWLENNIWGVLWSNTTTTPYGEQFITALQLFVQLPCPSVESSMNSQCLLPSCAQWPKPNTWFLQQTFVKLPPRKPLSITGRRVLWKCWGFPRRRKHTCAHAGSIAWAWHFENLNPSLPLRKGKSAWCARVGKGSCALDLILAKRGKTGQWNTILCKEGGLGHSVSSFYISPETRKNTFTSNTFIISRLSGENQPRGNPWMLLKHFYVDSFLRYKAVSELKSPLTQTLFFIIMHL